MFWKRKPQKTQSNSARNLEILAGSTELRHTKYGNLDLRRAILVWRDRHIENVELHLTRQLSIFYRALDSKLEKMTFRDLFMLGSFGKRTIAPMYKEWLMLEVPRSMSAAQDELAKIHVHVLESVGHASELSLEDDVGALKDAAKAAAAAAAAIAAIPGFLVMSTVPAWGVLGWLGLTTISLPIVAIGILVVGSLLALGVYKAASLKSNAIRRYRKAIVKNIESQVLGRDGNSVAICKKLQKDIELTANKIIEEIDRC